MGVDILSSQTGWMMESKKLHTISITVVVLAVLGGGWYLYANLLGRPYLDGELEYDFGTVWLEGYETTVSHTFELVNRTNEIIEVRDVVSSCQCTIPSSNSRRVIPGDSFMLTAELTLRKSGLQRPSITLFLDGNRRQRLWVSAVGKRKLPLVYLGEHIELLMGLPRNLAVRCEIYQSKKEPPPLRVRSTKGVSANFKRWKIIEFYDEKWQNPAIFVAELIVTRNVMELPENATIDVSIDGENWLSVPINRTDLQRNTRQLSDFIPGS